MKYVLICLLLVGCCKPISKVDFDGSLMDPPKKMKKLNDKIEVV